MAPQASRRFHEAGVGSRTGLRLSAVARDQDGFEDLEAFYKASQAALEHQRPDQDEQQYDDDDDEDDYDSFDETRFSRRSNAGGVNGRNRAAASSSSMMDIQNSSAPSPRSVLRSARASAANSSPARNGRAHANITLADDDDDFDLPNLSTGSRSFDLGAADAQSLRAPPTPSIPERGLSARKAGTQPSPKAKGKAKEAATAVRRVDLSDSEDDRILASIQHRLESAYDDEDDQDMGVVSDYEIVPVRPSPAKTTTATAKAPASQPKSPKRPKASQTRIEERHTIPAAAAPSPKRKKGHPPKSHDVGPELDDAYALDYDEPEPQYFPPQSPTPPPAAPEPPKRKRGRPPKNPPAEKESSATTAKKPGRPAASASKSSSKTKPAAGEVVERVRSQPREATVFDENGVRRSTRQRFAPLEYWRGERIRYGRPSLPSGTTVEDLRRSHRPGEDEFEDDPSMMLMRKRVPVLDVKEVIRVPRAPGEGTFAGTRRARTTNRRKIDRKSEERTPRLTSQTPDPFDDDAGWIQLDPTADTVHVEDGWDDRTVEAGIVIDDDEGREVETSVVRTKASLRPMAAANQEFRFEKLFNCGGLMATGVLELPPGSRKPTKPSKDNSFVFCVLQGALRATVHRKTFVVGPQGIFHVPAGNTYSLENICQRDVHLFFAQCRKTKKANAGDLTTFTQMSDTSYGTPGLAATRAVLGAGVGGRAYAAGYGAAGEHLQAEEEDSEADARALAAKKPRNASKGGRAAVREPALVADSDAEDSGEDDFETSRQIRSKTKKRVFRRL
ncbi:related to inner kinetochore protein MIF2 [Sporisorium reilianum f. sp. reilianum]|uniref:CENP-C homolog n=1 Tax=Sporisorium reilianum f. sp. reilianum TaxID=72559 RepID=A0A2N8U5J7_9BASI|nr:related to inner kinetochore protein MIF2 [Sporisorium reilianum f. sp. reilianum]